MRGPRPVRWPSSHFVTFQGMVNTEINSYATVPADEDHQVIEGFGREPGRIGPIGAPAHEV